MAIRVFCVSCFCLSGFLYKHGLRQNLVGIRCKECIVTQSKSILGCSSVGPTSLQVQQLQVKLKQVTTERDSLHNDNVVFQARHKIPEKKQEEIKQTTTLVGTPVAMLGASTEYDQ